MKRLITLFLSLCMTWTLVACGGSDEKEEINYDQYYGIWKLVKIEKEGKTYTVEDLENSGDYSATDYYILLTEDNLINLYSGYKDEWKNGKWEIKEGNIYLGSMPSTIENDLLKMENEGVYFYLEKYAESQNKEDIPVKKQEVVQPETNTPRTGVSDEFKATMDAYEAFFNEYVEFMIRYQNAEDASSMMFEYLDFMTKYADAMAKLDEIENQELTNEEYLYYTEVMLRINQKLLSAL